MSYMKPDHILMAVATAAHNSFETSTFSQEDVYSHEESKSIHRRPRQDEPGYSGGSRRSP